MQREKIYVVLSALSLSIAAFLITKANPTFMGFSTACTIGGHLCVCNINGYDVFTTVPTGSQTVKIIKNGIELTLFTNTVRTKVAYLK